MVNILVIDLGKAGSFGTPLFSQNVFAGNQCPGRPDPSCRVPWPPHFCRALHPSTQELDGEEERQWRGPGTSKWKKTWLRHSPAPHPLREHKVFLDQKVDWTLSYLSTNLSLIVWHQGFREQSALPRINTNAQTLVHLAIQGRKALLKSFIPTAAILATCSFLPAHELSWRKEMGWGMKRRIWVSFFISQKCGSCLERSWSTEVLL